jgi:outer membrane protein TolC
MSSQEIANYLQMSLTTLVQTSRAATAACDTQRDTESRYKLGATPFYARLTAGQQCQSARVQHVRARASRLADTAALFESMGDPPVEHANSTLQGAIGTRKQMANGGAVAVE